MVIRRRQDNGKLLRNFGLLTILSALALGTLTQAAVVAEKAPVKINYVTGSLLVDKKSGRSGDLNSISFSIENAATRPLEWVRLRVTTRSPAGALLQTETFEEELGKNPIGSREARRVTRYMSIDGFLIGGKQGSIDIDVVDYRLSPEGGWLLLIPPSRDISSETGYFDSIRRSIELTWKYPELALRYGLQGRLLLEFSLLDNGDLESVKIVRSSGSNLLDEEALRAVKAAVLPRIPGRLLISASMEYHSEGRRLDMLRVDSYDLTKPISEWRHVKSFNNLTTCEEYKKKEAAQSRCVSSDSLTIK